MNDDKPINEYTASDLDSLYSSGEECDKRMFAEMRTNLQLVAGEHYVKEGSKFWNRVRDDKQLTEAQRLKLVKNHIQRVTKIYRNEIEAFSADVAITAANEKELQDQKAAELNYSYWQYVKSEAQIDKFRSTWISNFVEIGEVFVKVFWVNDEGNIIGYEAQMDPETQQPITDPMTGEPIQDESKPVYGGKLKFETIEGYNVRRDPGVRSLDESPYLIVSKLVTKKALRTLIPDAEMLKRLSQESPTMEYTVYDNNTGYYRAAKDQILIKEMYWRPAKTIPNGYFFIWSSQGIIASGELPYGIFPIVYEGFDEQTGNARSHSIIRHARPAQIEINRCASKMAEHQVTHGDDKVWIQSNTKISQGAMLPGIRVNSYSGMKPEVTQGHTGDQYLPYMESQINELYVLVNLAEIVEDQPETTDMYTSLMRSYRFKKKFALYGQKFERFLVRLVKTALDIAKHSASDEDLIPAFGRSEYINVPEFKNTEDINYQIRVQPRPDDLESQFGKQITINTILQYAGQQIDKEHLGVMLRNSPFLNKEQMFKPFTQKYDRLCNDLLALDRGQWRPPKKFDDHTYVIDGLVSRMSDADFDQLPGQVQEMYQVKLQMHEQAKTIQLEEIQRAQSGFIPSGGYLVKCDFYVADPKNPSSTKRVSLPSESVAWLIKQLETQGSEMNQLEDMSKGVLQDIGTMIGGSNNEMLSQLPVGQEGMNAA